MADNMDFDLSKAKTPLPLRKQASVVNMNEERSSSGMPSELSKLKRPPYVRLAG